MIYDVIIIGGGPAGLTAAIYASRARLTTLLVESFTVVSQAVTASDIENYPGFPEGISGFLLMEKLKKQASGFGAEFKTGDVKKISRTEAAGGVWKLEKDKETFQALSVIIASGSRPRKLGIAGEDKFRGKGVSYCAVCDAAFFKDKDVIVVGGGNAAAEEALFLTRFAKSVTIAHRRDRLRATKILEERLRANKKIKFVWSSLVKEILGDNKVNALRIENVKTKKKKEIPCDGIFVLVGYDPNTGFLEGLIKLDEKGYVPSDDDMKTEKEGIFACGDARKKKLRQIVTACGEGATAAYSARMYVEELKGIAYK